jgi:hypothetical protein
MMADGAGAVPLGSIDSKIYVAARAVAAPAISVMRIVRTASRPGSSII